MRSPALPHLLVAAALAPALLPRPAAADEGMWTFDRPPLALLAERYGFEPDAEWLEHLRLSSVRLNDGGSGSFISPDGLLLTNHHVGAEAIAELSTAERDLVAEGFYASTRAEELRCQDLELNVLVSIEDVTERVLGAVGEGADEAAARTQREAEIARIEQEASEASGLRSEVVELYSGGAYVLHGFRRYTDVRLVFAPDMQAAFFGGDADNFHFPRYCLDVAIFRAYEAGEPAATPHYLRWSETGPVEGELVFVSGNPGSTGRLSTVAQLELLRDLAYPLYIEGLRHRRAALLEYAARGAEEERQAQGELFGIDNSIKALGGYLDSLRAGQSIERKAAQEHELRRRVAADPDLEELAGGAWEAIDRAQAAKAELLEREYYSRIRGSRLFSIARDVVRLVEERGKPNDERLPEYRESALPSLELALYSDAPIYPDLEEVEIAAALERMRAELGADDPLVQAAARGVAATEASFGASRLVDPDYRRELVEGGPEAVAASEDPMIRFVRAIDPIARELRQRLEDEVQSVEAREGGRIARARFAIHGASVYPDATFSLRLSFGVVRGYQLEGYPVPWKTTFHGLYERAAAFDHQPPYDLPEPFAGGAEALDRGIAYDFVCTADIIGGNSGSPVVDRAGELVGLIFDGNIQMLGNRFVYDDTVARAVSVHSAGILEALRTVYRTEALVEEILAARGPGGHGNDGR